jgi:hypothetical protein
LLAHVVAVVVVVVPMLGQDKHEDLLRMDSWLTLCFLGIQFMSVTRFVYPLSVLKGTVYDS